MQKQHLTGTIYTKNNEKICQLLTILTHDNIFENVFLVPLNQNLNQYKLSSVYHPISKNRFAAEAIINRFMGCETPIPHIDFLKTLFTTTIYKNLFNLKYGQTITYKDLACLSGNEKAARAVGNALRMNPLPIIYPCHRVVAVNGFGGFSGNHDDFIEIKKKFLRIEKNGESIVLLDK